MKFATWSALAGMVALLLIPLQAGEVTPVVPDPGVKPPKVKKRIPPLTSTYARAYRIQGMVILEALVTEDGRATDVRVISPLGYGLDEKAVESVEQWQFSPALKQEADSATPVPMNVYIQVDFRRPIDPRRPIIRPYDDSYERQRARFNVALVELKRNNNVPSERELKTMQDLADDGFMAALHVVGLWQIEGKYLPRDREAGLLRIQKAAKKNYGPAIFEVAMQAARDSNYTNMDWDRFRQAAMLGSTQAQYTLGDRHESGRGVEKDADRAKNYFKLCSARGVADCQYRLGRMLTKSSTQADPDFEQGMAWLALASENGNAQAKRAWERQKDTLNAEQAKTVSTLKQQFAGKYD